MTNFKNNHNILMDLYGECVTKLCKYGCERNSEREGHGMILREARLLYDDMEEIHVHVGALGNVQNSPTYSVYKDVVVV